MEFQETRVVHSPTAVLQSNWRELIKPKRLEVEEKSLTPTYGKFFGEPFERGYGTTIGNALRRVLLSSLQGAAIVAVRVNGVLHEFSTLPGVVEDVTDIVLNLKEVRVKLNDGATEEVAHIRVRGERAGDRGRHPGRPARRDPEPATSTSPPSPRTPSSTWSWSSGSAAATCRPSATSARSDPVGTIPIDAIFSPVTKVNFVVTNARVGQRTDYDKLTLEVNTDGSVRPEDAVAYAARILQDQLGIFVNFEEQPAGAEGESSRETAGQREPLPAGRGPRAERALGELPAERRHPLHRRAGAEDRAGDAQDQELRPQVAERDQGDPPRDGARPRDAARQLPRRARSSIAGACARAGDRPEPCAIGSQGRSSAGRRRIAARCSATSSRSSSSTRRCAPPTPRPRS